MSFGNRTKLNRLLRAWPSRAICLSSWLQEKGISQPLASCYVKSGWLERVGTGAYKRAGESVGWPSGLRAVQCQAKREIHLGGKSALLYQGYGHYLPLGEGYPLYLFGERYITLPAWFRDAAWDVDIAYIQTKLFPALKESFTVVDMDGIKVKASSAERAMMEVIHLVPQRASYDDALKLMGSLSAIRPKVVQLLLENCQSIKVKRAFMVMAERYQYPWLSALDLDMVDFGTGKRQFIKNGYLEPKYQITIPRDFYDDVDVVV